MRAVVQRVLRAAVHIGGREHARVERGLLVLLGVETGDTEADAEWLCGKIACMRVFADAEGVMNLDVAQVGGGSYIRAARREEAVPLYQRCAQLLAERSGRPVRTGVFGADMQVEGVNDGPVTIVVDSRIRE